MKTVEEIVAEIDRIIYSIQNFIDSNNAWERLSEADKNTYRMLHNLKSFIITCDHTYDALLEIAEALEKIENYEDEFGAPKYGIMSSTRCREIAREALKKLEDL